MKSTKDIERRSPCVFSNALELFGDRWTLLVIRDFLIFGKHEYKEFLASPEGIATNILSDRLKKLSEAGVIDELPHPESRARKLYYLTEKGKDLLPLLVAMAEWGEKHLDEMEQMEPLFDRIRQDPKGFQKQILRDLRAWEKQFV